LGSHGFRKTTGQTDPEVVYLKYVEIDHQAGAISITYLLCKCSKKLIEGEGDSFYCDHCDRPCYAGNCKYCEELFMVEE
jgi:hypothetical protein